MKAAVPLRAISRSFWGRLALHASWLHGCWEAAQCGAFYDREGVSSASGMALMVDATLANIALTLLLVWATLRLGAKNTRFCSLRAPPSLIGLGATAALLIEAGAQPAALWRSSAAMPVPGVFGWPIGILPLIQMAVLPFLSLVFASNWIGFR